MAAHKQINTTIKCIIFSTMSYILANYIHWESVVSSKLAYDEQLAKKSQGYTL
jgi:hypothetical protein